MKSSTRHVLRETRKTLVTALCLSGLIVNGQPIPIVDDCGASVGAERDVSAGGEFFLVKQHGFIVLAFQIPDPDGAGVEGTARQHSRIGAKREPDGVAHLKSSPKFPIAPNTRRAGDAFARVPSFPSR